MSNTKMEPFIHPRQLNRRSGRTTRAIYALIVAGIVIALVTAHYLPSPETRDPEIILNDTLQMDAGDISRDSALKLMKETPAGREYDSVVRAQEKIDSMSVGPWTMDSIASYLTEIEWLEEPDPTHTAQ